MFNVFKASFFIQSAPSISFLLYKRSTNTKSKESKKKGNIYHPKYDPSTTRKPKSKTSKEKKIKRKQ
jgi:hypothetical protein